MIWLIIFPNLVLADVFLQLHPSDGVWWSMDCIMFFALTGHVVTNFRPSLSSVLSTTQDQVTTATATTTTATATTATVTTDDADLAAAKARAMAQQ